MEQSIADFKAADTQVLGVSVDSKFSHDNWASSLGGVSYPLLADFHPKGAMAQSYGVYLEKRGLIARSTVIIDKQGVVRYATLVEAGAFTPAETGLPRLAPGRYPGSKSISPILPKANRTVPAGPRPEKTRRMAGKVYVFTLGRVVVGKRSVL